MSLELMVYHLDCPESNTFSPRMRNDEDCDYNQVRCGVCGIKVAVELRTPIDDLTEEGHGD